MMAKNDNGNDFFRKCHKSKTVSDLDRTMNANNFLAIAHSFQNWHEIFIVSEYSIQFTPA